MSRHVIIRLQAEIDITDAAICYQKQNPGLAREFLREIGDAIARAASSPRQFRRLRIRPEVRRIRLDRFPYKVFFIVR